MGCITFTACFGPRTRSRKRSNLIIQDLKKKKNINCHDHRVRVHEINQCLYSTSDPPVAIIKKDADVDVDADAAEEQKSNQRKKVAYHTHTHIQNSSKKELNPPLVVEESDIMGQEEETFFPNSIQKFECKDHADSSSASSLFTYPTNHRYQNCSTSDDDESEVTGLADDSHGENADNIVKGSLIDVDNIIVSKGSPFDGENADKGNNDHMIHISSCSFDGVHADSIDGDNNIVGKGSPFHGENADKGNNDHIISCPFDDGVHADSIGEGQPPPFVQQESSESLFSLSIDSRKAAEIGGEKEVSSPFKLPSIEMNQQNARRSTHSVLNPIENMRALKENNTVPSFKDQETEFPSTEKENHYQSAPPLIEESMRQAPKEAVNTTSLSSWLMESGKSKTNGKNSPVSVGNSSSKRTNSSSRSFDDRTILGVLTLEELKQQSRFLALPNSSPEDTQIMGTVGSYWVHTGQCIELNSNSSSRKTSSKSGQCKEGRMKENSTTSFQARH